MTDDNDVIHDPSAWLKKWPDKGPGKGPSILAAWTKVHARFGLVAQQACELETGLRVLIAQSRQWKKRSAELAVLLKELHDCSDPLGLLIKEFKTTFSCADDSDLGKELNLALRNRNYLIHHFYRDQGSKFTTPEGCEELHEMLMKFYDDFDAALSRLNHFCDERLGCHSQDEILDEINQDVAKWKIEHQQKLDAMLGKHGRPI